MQGHDKYHSRELDVVRGHKQPYSADFGVSADDICYYGCVYATSPEKAKKKARRLQIKTGWPHVSVAALPSKVLRTTEEETGPRVRFCKARKRFQHLINGRWVNRD